VPNSRGKSLLTTSLVIHLARIEPVKTIVLEAKSVGIMWEQPMEMANFQGQKPSNSH